MLRDMELILLCSNSIPPRFYCNHLVKYPFEHSKIDPISEVTFHSGWSDLSVSKRSPRVLRTCSGHNGPVHGSELFKCPAPVGRSVEFRRECTRAPLTFSSKLARTGSVWWPQRNNEKRPFFLLCFIVVLTVFHCTTFTDYKSRYISLLNTGHPLWICGVRLPYLS